MKTLILVRHAKSSWDDIRQKDIDRPLTEKGKKDAGDMAKRLKEKNISIDLFVSSTARRAKKTAKIFAAGYKSEEQDIMLVDYLYEPTTDSFMKAVMELPDEKDTVAIFSHNPGITQFANSLSIVHVDDMPTCAVFGLAINTKSWGEFREAGKNFLFFDYPKNPLGH
jgi:phosphohistidine phosphatase